MELKKPKEYQTISLFAILGLLTLMTVLFFKVVLFAPQNPEVNRIPAEASILRPELPNLQPIQIENKLPVTPNK